jgi:hypothetical protein
MQARATPANGLATGPSSKTDRIVEMAHMFRKAPSFAARFFRMVALTLTVAACLAVAAFAQGRHADPALEALLPTSLGGMALTVESQAGAELTTSSGPFDRFLSELGRTRADFTIASAYSQGELRAAVGAWRVKGAVTEKLVPSFVEAVQASSTTPLAVAEETVGARAVTRIGDPGQMTQGPLYVIARGDTLLFVQTPEPALAEEAMGKLPR